MLIYIEIRIISLVCINEDRRNLLIYKKIEIIFYDLYLFFV